MLQARLFQVSGPSPVPRLTHRSRAEEDPQEVDDPEDGQDGAEDLDTDVDLQAEERLEAGHLITNAFSFRILRQGPFKQDYFEPHLPSPWESCLRWTS